MTFIEYIRNLWVNLGMGLGRQLMAWGMSATWATIVVNIVIILILVIVGVSTVIVFTPMERKIIARMQDRPGPNRVWPYGLTIAFADAIKMLTKEMIFPKNADRVVYNVAPALIVIPALMIYAVLPFGPAAAGASLSVGAASLNVGVLYFVALGSISTIAVLMAGWGSNNKFALLGGFRVVNQLLAYEVPMILSILAVVIFTGTMSTQEIVAGQSIPYLFVMPIAAMTFIISVMAELNRAPFDLIEAESELVAGYQVEYSGMRFAMFYIAEYVSMFAGAVMISTLFLGGYKFFGLENLAPVLTPFILFGKAFFVIFCFLWIRGTFPRVRLDQLIGFAWKFLVPLSLVNLILVGVVAKLGAPGAAVPDSDKWLPMVQGGVLLIMNLVALAIAFYFLNRALRRPPAVRSLAPAERG
jgi:NADH-quinone oxidoreductase subunit H